MTFRSEPVVGHLAIRGRAGLKLYKGKGTAQAEVPMTYAKGFYHIDLKPDLATYWLFLK